MHHGGRWQLALVRSRFHHVLERGEDRVARRQRRHPRQPRRGQRDDCRRHGSRCPGAQPGGLGDRHHRYCGSRRRHYGEAGRHGLFRLGSSRCAGVYPPRTISRAIAGPCVRSRSHTRCANSCRGSATAAPEGVGRSRRQPERMTGAGTGNEAKRPAFIGARAADVRADRSAAQRIGSRPSRFFRRGGSRRPRRLAWSDRFSAQRPAM